ncbi:hypothetical protein ACFL60_05775 [Candidatus Omnitrophota bacterium]
MISEERQKEQYNKSGNFPRAWYFSFSSLLTASKILYDKYPTIDCEKSIRDGTPPMPTEFMMVFGVIKMLRAMALEDLLKALWLKGGGILVEKGKYQKIPETNDHDLISIADKVSGIVDCGFNAQERDLLKRLSLSITSGRYPIQSSWVKSKIQKLHGGGMGPPSGGWSFPRDEELFESLVLRLTHIFEEADSKK